MNAFHKILKSKNLSTTRVRVNMLSVLSSSNLPLSEKELEEAMDYACDRATIYRNLSSLTEKGILVRLLSGDAFKYKMKAINSKKEKKPDHLHFQCTKCNRLICLEDIPVSDFKLPGGYIKTENHFLVTGICKDCNTHD